MDLLLEVHSIPVLAPKMYTKSPAVSWFCISGTCAVLEEEGNPNDLFESDANSFVQGLSSVCSDLIVGVALVAQINDTV